MKDDDRFYPDIYDYLDKQNLYPVTSEGLDDIIKKIHLETGVERSILKIIVADIFQELRNILFKGGCFYFPNIGRMFINASKFNKAKRDKTDQDVRIRVLTFPKLRKQLVELYGKSNFGKHKIKIEQRNREQQSGEENSKPQGDTLEDPSSQCNQLSHIRVG